MRKRVVVILLAASSVCVPKPGGATGFDFESLPTGYYKSITLSDGAETLTVTPHLDPAGWVLIGDATFGVSPVPPLLGAHAAIGVKDNPILQSGRFDPLRFDFSIPVTSITFAFGDGGGDSDSPVTVQAFDNANNPLGSLTTDYPFGFAAGKTLTGTYASGASSFILSSGSVSDNENSIYWEVPSLSPVPEPASVLLFGSGLAGLAGATWRRRVRR